MLSLLRLKTASCASGNMPAPGLPPCDASHNFRTIQNDSERFRMIKIVPRSRPGTCGARRDRLSVRGTGRTPALVRWVMRMAGRKAACFVLRRRDFITLLGGAAATWPLATHAQQQPKMLRVGFVGIQPREGACLYQFSQANG